jgi:hypothetical protein
MLLVEHGESIFGIQSDQQGAMESRTDAINLSNTYGTVFVFHAAHSCPD